MSVRKRAWKNSDGSQGEAWVVAYTDRSGKRRIKSFDRKRDAAAYQASVATDMRSGVHVPDSQSVTVAEAGRLWLRRCESAGLERSTVDYYRQHLELHIIPLIGAVKLSRLTAPMVRAFEDELALDRSPAMVRKVARLAWRDSRRRPGARPCRTERGARRARPPTPRQGSARRQAPEGQAQGRRRHPLARRDPGDHRPSRGPLAAAAPDCDLHRPARVRAARLALGRRRSQARRTARAAARRLLQRDRPPQVRSRRAHRPARCRCWSARCARTDSPAPRASSTSSSPTVPAMSRAIRTSSSAGFSRRRSRRRRQRSGRGEISRPARARGTSTRAGASTAASTAGSNCRSSWCRRGWDTPRFR